MKEHLRRILWPTSRPIPPGFVRLWELPGSALRAGGWLLEGRGEP